ncbi:MAG TPA: hypothetical protein VHP63_02395, partial [candidate division Zixibacteria bacterium]|nr:hypothetical protein [candidate division Zixibacteria bacterium]
MSLVVFVTILSSVIAQSETLEPQVKKVDQAVPQAPALTLLGISEEKLLRPATMQELIASIESKDGFAVELSPLRLMRGKHLTLDEYSKNPFLYQTRFSVGLERGTNNAVTKMGFGLRFTIVDRSDLRLDSSYLYKTNELLTALSETIDAQTGPTGEISSSAS